MKTIAHTIHRGRALAPVAHARGLALLCVAGGALSLYAAALSFGGSAWGALDAGLAFLGGALCWALARRLRLWMLHLAVVALALSGAHALGTAADPAASTLALTALLWTSVYVGATCAPPIARVHAAVLVLGAGAALLIGDAAGGARLLIPVAGTLLATIELLSRMTAGLRRRAFTDPLTGFYNRNGFREASRSAIATCRRAGVPLTLAQIDLDGFKLINDREGHLEGDRLLAQCADSLRSRVRAGDVLARLGGDEFTLLLPGSDRADAAALLEELRRRSPLGWSYGTAQLEPGEDIETCMERADAALYKAKHAKFTRVNLPDTLARGSGVAVQAPRCLSASWSRSPARAVAPAPSICPGRVRPA